MQHVVIESPAINATEWTADRIESATRFLLCGSGHAEGALFRWLVSDFSLSDAIERIYNHVDTTTN